MRRISALFWPRATALLGALLNVTSTPQFSIVKGYRVASAFAGALAIKNVRRQKGTIKDLERVIMATKLVNEFRRVIRSVKLKTQAYFANKS
jgi:hypothetical protein